VVAAAALMATPAPLVLAAVTKPSPAPVSVTVNRTEVGRPIPPGFIGFSFEFQAVRAYTGANPHAINPVLVRLIRNLAPGQTPILRIGGNSTDGSWWPAPGVTPSPGINYTLTRSWLATTRMLAADAGARLILGLNLKLGSRGEIAAEARAFTKGIGDRLIDAFEIGNEPELYPIVPYYYRQPGEVPVYPRPRGYGFRAYTREISTFTKVLRGNPLAGPATGQSPWLAHLPKLFAAAPDLKVVTYHRYPLIRCFTKPGDPGYPSIPNLLSLRASRGLLRGASEAIALAHRLGALFRVDELNSVACRGQEGVSDTFASALWVLDTLFVLSRAGVDGVNIHTWRGSDGKLFDMHYRHHRWVGSVQPEYYGMLMFARAAPPGSRLEPVTQSSAGRVRAWAVLAPGGSQRVVLINDDLRGARWVIVRPPAPSGRAELERLLAPSPYARSKVTLAGQSFSGRTTTGLLTGAPDVTVVRAQDGGYLVRMPAASAALLTFGT
jgi:hypothetical protein